MLREAGAQPVLAPTIEIVPPNDPAAADQAVARASAYTWIVFTSVNGVRVFFEKMQARREDARTFGSAKIAAIGIKTSQALLERCVYADIVPQSFVAEDLAELLIASSRPGDKVLVFRAQEARDVLPLRLREAGRDVDVVAAYQTVYADDPGLADKVASCEILTFTSASTVRGFVHNLHGAQAAARAAGGKIVACIGPITADEARKNGLQATIIADEFTADGLLAALERVTPA